MRDTVFFKQAELLLRTLPLIHKVEVFALKGGTAINFFVRELPRLSVDIDLTYLPVNERDFALDDISRALFRVSNDRQHPRDLFDVHFLVKNEGLTAEMRRAFIVYLISHPELW